MTQMTGDAASENSETQNEMLSSELLATFESKNTWATSQVLAVAQSLDLDWKALYRLAARVYRQMYKQEPPELTDVEPDPALVERLRNRNTSRQPDLSATSPSESPMPLDSMPSASAPLPAPTHPEIPLS